MTARGLRSALVGACALGALVVARPAAADQMVIKFPGEHPRYVFEAEPHGLLAPYAHFLPGVGFRGTVRLLHNGFVPSINNSIGIGFGADWVDKGVWIPIVMQWNFWLSRNWSVFGEPGVAIHAGHGFEGKHDDRLGILGLWAGGRFHFNDRIALTLRVGRPTFSVGVSFFL
jgi:hypothetical protein